MQLHEWLVYNQKNHIVVVTKADKLSNNKLKESIKVIEKNLPNSRIIAFSSVSGKGKDEVWQEILANL